MGRNVGTTNRIQADDFFVLRTPLLPVDDFETWSQGLLAPGHPPGDEGLDAAVAADRALLRQRLEAQLERPEVLEALFVASPSLVAGLATWRRDPESKKGQRAENALVRYFARMCMRPTPFGLFAGCSLGRVGSWSELELLPRESYRRTSRLDMDYVFELTQALARSSELVPHLIYRPNSSLYAAGDRLRYVEAHQGEGRTYQLVGVETDEYLETVLDRSREGASMSVLTSHLTQFGSGDVSREEAEEYVVELAENQILVPDLDPYITGTEAVESVVDRLPVVAASEPTATVLRSVNAELASMDAAGLGNPPGRYRRIAESLSELPVEPHIARLFQVDMTKPAARATLGPQVLAELERGVELLSRFAGGTRDAGLDGFRDAFVTRYQDGQLVPLLVALDEDVGVGFGGGERAPLLEGIFMGSPAAAPTVEWGAPAAFILRQLWRTAVAGGEELELEASELERLGDSERRPLPDSFQLSARIAARSSAALRRGDFRLQIVSAFGPSGVRILGRFCHTDVELTECVRRHLDAEEAADPEAVFAEIVHLPEGRMGNILCRPLLRGYEIPFLGRSGAPPERQIPLQDLSVTVRGGRVMLFSERLGKRVVPRLTSAHNFTARSLGAYRFLASLQELGLQHSLYWPWGVFDGLDYLPRVVSGRLVLSRARWRLREEEIQTLAEKSPTERFRAAQELKRRRRLPGRIALRDGDNELPVNLDNGLSVDALVSAIRRRSQCELVELFPAREELCTAGPEGNFTNEILVPFHSVPSPGRKYPEPLPVAAVRRSYPPGSEWLYAKLYAGPAIVDRTLLEVVEPIVGLATGSGAADRWFFLRFGDPEWHVRLRFHGRPAELHGRVLPWLQRGLEEALGDGRLWRFQLDTYEREVERYGGAQAIGLAEELACIDSDAVLALLAHEHATGGTPDERWRWALLGADLLLTDFRLSSEEQFMLLDRLNNGFANEFKIERVVQQQLAKKFRAERPSLEELLEVGREPGESFAVGRILAERSRRLRPVVDRLLELDERGALSGSVSDLVMSFVHMYTNRLLRSAGRVHELVIYDFLRQLKRATAARKRRTA